MAGKTGCHHLFANDRRTPHGDIPSVYKGQVGGGVGWGGLRISLKILKLRCPFLLKENFVIAWKRFPHYWPFAKGIHRSPISNFIAHVTVFVIIHPCSSIIMGRQRAHYCWSIAGRSAGIECNVTLHVFIVGSGLINSAQRPVSISDKTPYDQISWNLEIASLVI